MSTHHESPAYGLELAPAAMQPSRDVAPIEILLLTIPQAARVLQISTRTVETLVSNGQLKSVTIGKSRRIFSDDLRDFARTGVQQIWQATKQNLRELAESV